MGEFDELAPEPDFAGESEWTAADSHFYYRFPEHSELFSEAA